MCVCVRWQPADFVDDVYIDTVKEKETAISYSADVEIKARDVLGYLIGYCSRQDIITVRY